jgi:hypothetical protein
VAQRSGLLGAGRKRKARGSLGERGVAQRHQDGEAVEPHTVQLAEGGRQQGVVVVRGLRLRDGRRTPPSCIGARASRLRSVGPGDNPPAGRPFSSSQLDFVVEYRHPS